VLLDGFQDQIELVPETSGELSFELFECWLCMLLEVCFNVCLTGCNHGGKALRRDSEGLEGRIKLSQPVLEFVPGILSQGPLFVELS
jgi:hypothetical protein